MGENSKIYEQFVYNLKNYEGDEVFTAVIRDIYYMLAMPMTYERLRSLFEYDSRSDFENYLHSNGCSSFTEFIRKHKDVFEGFLDVYYAIASEDGQPALWYHNRLIKDGGQGLPDEDVFKTVMYYQRDQRPTGRSLRRVKIRNIDDTKFFEKANKFINGRREFVKALTKAEENLRTCRGGYLFYHQFQKEVMDEHQRPFKEIFKQWFPNCGKAEGVLESILAEEIDLKTNSNGQVHQIKLKVPGSELIKMLDELEYQRTKFIDDLERRFHDAARNWGSPNMGFRSLRSILERPFTPASTSSSEEEDNRIESTPNVASPPEHDDEMSEESDDENASGSRSQTYNEHEDEMSNPSDEELGPSVSPTRVPKLVPTSSRPTAQVSTNLEPSEEAEAEKEPEYTDDEDENSKFQSLACKPPSSQRTVRPSPRTSVTRITAQPLEESDPKQEAEPEYTDDEDENSKFQSLVPKSVPSKQERPSPSQPKPSSPNEDVSPVPSFRNSQFPIFDQIQNDFQNISDQGDLRELYLEGLNFHQNIISKNDNSAATKNAPSDDDDEFQSAQSENASDDERSVINVDARVYLETDDDGNVADSESDHDDENDSDIEAIWRVSGESATSERRSSDSDDSTGAPMINDRDESDSESAANEGEDSDASLDDMFNKNEEDNSILDDISSNAEDLGEMVSSDENEPQILEAPATEPSCQPSSDSSSIVKVEMPSNEPIPPATPAQGSRPPVSIELNPSDPESDEEEKPSPPKPERQPFQYLRGKCPENKEMSKAEKERRRAEREQLNGTNKRGKSTVVANTPTYNAPGVATVARPSPATETVTIPPPSATAGPSRIIHPAAGAVRTPPPYVPPVQRYVPPRPQLQRLSNPIVHPTFPHAQSQFNQQSSVPRPPMHPQAISQHSPSPPISNLPEMPQNYETQNFEYSSRSSGVSQLPLNDGNSRRSPPQPRSGDGYPHGSRQLPQQNVDPYFRSGQHQASAPRSQADNRTEEEMYRPSSRQPLPPPQGNRFDNRSFESNRNFHEDSSGRRSVQPQHQHPLPRSQGYYCNEEISRSSSRPQAYVAPPQGNHFDGRRSVQPQHQQPISRSPHYYRNEEIHWSTSRQQPPMPPPQRFEDDRMHRSNGDFNDEFSEDRSRQEWEQQSQNPRGNALPRSRSEDFHESRRNNFPPPSAGYVGSSRASSRLDYAAPPLYQSDFEEHFDDPRRPPVPPSRPRPASAMAMPRYSYGPQSSVPRPQHIAEEEQMPDEQRQIVDKMTETIDVIMTVSGRTSFKKIGKCLDRANLPSNIEMSDLPFDSLRDFLQHEMPQYEIRTFGRENYLIDPNSRRSP